jgi:hypothetical protein
LLDDEPSNFSTRNALSADNFKLIFIASENQLNFLARCSSPTSDAGNVGKVSLSRFPTFFSWWMEANERDVGNTPTTFWDLKLARSYALCTSRSNNSGEQ